MIIQHNMTALYANRMNGVVEGRRSKETEKLSSGYRINRAGDDAAGLAISEKMRGQIRGLNQASANAQDGISLIQTAEGALTETHSILQRMRELAVQAASDTNTDDDRTQIQNEINQLTSEVDRIATTTEFNTKKLLDGSKTGSVSGKDGTIKIDGSFGNATVDAKVTIDGSKNQAYSDVIALKIQKDFTENMSTKATLNLSDNALEDIYNMIKTTTVTGAGITATSLSNEFKLQTIGADNKTVIQTGSLSKTLDERVADKITTEKNELKELKAAAETAKKAVIANDSALMSLVTGIISLNDKCTSNKFIKSNVTNEQITSAIKDYINALAENGSTTGSNIEESANGSSTLIEEKEKAIRELFVLTSAPEVAMTTGTPPTTGSVYSLTAAFFKSNNSASSLGTDAQNIDISAASDGTSVGAVAADVISDIFAIGKFVAGTKIDVDRYESDIEKEENIIRTLENKDLVNKVYDYFEAKKTYEDEKGTATDEKLQALTDARDYAKQALDEVNKAEDIIAVRDLFGNSASKETFEIDTEVDKNNNLKITLKNNEGADDTVITIANANKLKAGDKLTITTTKMVETKPAATGEDAIHLQIGANASQEMLLGINSMRARDLNIVQTKAGKEGIALNLTNQDDASLAINAYDLAIQKVSTERANMGAIQNRLEHTMANLNTSSENLQTAESRIRDTDIASMMVDFAKDGIIQQAAQSMLAQANQSNQGVLQLLQ